MCAHKLKLASEKNVAGLVHQNQKNSACAVKASQYIRNDMHSTSHAIHGTTKDLRTEKIFFSDFFSVEYLHV